MKKILSMLMLLTMTAFFSSCYASGSAPEPRGAMKNKTVQLKPFKAIEASGALNVTIYQGSPKSYVELKGYERGLKYSEVTVRNGKLSVAHKNNFGDVKDVVEVKIYCHDVTDLTSNGGASVYTQSMDGLKVSLCATAGAKLQVDAVTCNSANLTASAGGEIDVAGVKASTLAAEVSSGGSIDADKMATAVSTDLTASSGGSMKSHITTTRLKAIANSGGELELQGEATNDNFSASSGGNIEAEELTVNDLKANASSAGNISAKAVTADSHADLTGSVNVTKVK